MLRVAAYCRVSTGCDAQMGSYDNQVEMYIKKIANNPDWQLVDIYADPAMSGTTDQRPDFKRMLQDAENNAFDLLLVKSISRFARNTLVTLETINRLKSLGIGCFFEQEKIDINNPTSEIMLSVLSAMAQEESRNTSERIKRGLRMNYARGNVPWVPIYGYTRIDGEPYKIVENEAEVIRRIFDEYNKGINSQTIVDELNSEGIPSPGGSIWSINMLANLIKNEKYVGAVITNKYYVESYLTHKRKKNKGEIDQFSHSDDHDPIVDMETFETAQEIRKLRGKYIYPYGEYMVCPECGGKVKKVSPGWGCSCEKFYIPNSRLEKAMLNAYELLEDSTDPVTAEMKKENPEMKTVEYWWLRKLVDRITFEKNGRFMTVHWLCGQKTEVPTEYYRMKSDIRVMKMKRKKEEDAARKSCNSASGNTTSESRKSHRSNPEVVKISCKKKQEFFRGKGVRIYAGSNKNTGVPCNEKAAGGGLHKGVQHNEMPG